MIAKAKKWAVAALSLVLAVMLACTLISVLPKRAKAEVTPSAVFVQESSSTGQDWQSSGFGKNGWLIIGGASEVYSNLYDDADGTVALTGWTNNDKNTWLSTADGKGIAADESLNVRIDQWAFTSRAWRADASYLGAPYIPDTMTPAANRVDGRNTDLDDTAIAISKTTDETLYFTIYLYTGTVTPDAAEVPVDLFVYYADGTNTQLNLKNNVDGDAGESTSAKTIAEVMPHYGEAPLLGKTTVQAGTKYVTFKLEGTGDFQIIATRGTDESGTLIPDTVIGESKILNTRAPYFGGFFLDNEEPTPNEPVTTSAEHVLTKAPTDTVAETAIGRDVAAGTFPYGKNGYVIMNNESGSVYSNLYENDGEAIALNGWSSGNSNTWLQDANGNYIDAEDSVNSPIDRWTFNTRVWRAASESELSGLLNQDGMLYRPGTTEPITLRIDGSNAGTQPRLTDTSISIRKDTDRMMYFTVFLTGLNYTSINGENPVDLYVYQQATFGMNSAGDMSFYQGTPLLTQKVTLTSGGVYVTFKLEGKGEFQIIATAGTDEDGTVIGKAAPYLAGFFMDYDLTALEQPGDDSWFDITYSVGDGENNAANALDAKSGDSVTLHDAIAPYGYRFVGWYTTATFDEGTEVTGAYEITGDVTFYAKYEEVVFYIIGYDVGEGTNSNENPPRGKFRTARS